MHGLEHLQSLLIFAAIRQELGGLVEEADGDASYTRGYRQNHDEQAPRREVDPKQRDFKFEVKEKSWVCDNWK